MEVSVVYCLALVTLFVQPVYISPSLICSTDKGKDDILVYFISYVIGTDSKLIVCGRKLDGLKIFYWMDIWACTVSVNPAAALIKQMKI